MDLYIKLEKNTNRTFALNWKNFSEEMDFCIKLEKITNRTFALNWKNFKKISKSRIKNLPTFGKLITFSSTPFVRIRGEFS